MYIYMNLRVDLRSFECVYGQNFVRIKEKRESDEKNIYIIKNYIYNLQINLPFIELDLY